MVGGVRQVGRKQMEADVSAWRKETSCQIVYPAASSSANNQLTTGLVHPPRQSADSSWQLVTLHTEQTGDRGTKLPTDVSVLKFSVSTQTQNHSTAQLQSSKSTVTLYNKYTSGSTHQIVELE